MTSDPPSRACDDVPPPEAEDLNQGFGVERDRHARATPIPLTRPAVLLIIGSWMEWAKGLMRTPAAKADTPLADGGFAPSEIERI